MKNYIGWRYGNAKSWDCHGSISDFEVVKKAIEVLKEFNIEVEARILSAHRTPYDAAEYARQLREEG